MKNKSIGEASGASENSVPENLKFQAIPQAILVGVGECLKHFAAPIIGISGEKKCFLGSCTLVESKGHHFLLTATHVWEKLRHFMHAGIVVRREPSPSMKIPTDLLKPIVVGKRKTDEWGPDLTFLGLADSDAGKIGAYKSFWNLGKRREMKLTRLEGPGHGMWVITGAPDEQRVRKASNHEAFEMRASVCPLEAYFPQSRFDYVDLGIDTMAANSLRTYGGMSGSGAWRVNLLRNRAGELIWQPRELSLEGVAFYESPVVDGHRIIRCHARKSLYSEGLDAIDASWE